MSRDVGEAVLDVIAATLQLFRFLDTARTLLVAVAVLGAVMVVAGLAVMARSRMARVDDPDGAQ